MAKYQGPALGGLDKEKLLVRLERKTIQIDNCWVYHGGSKTVDGYTRINIDRKAYGVHRLSAYIFHKLDLSSDLQANHKDECSSKLCWNPEHIYVGTKRQNTIDSVRMKTHKESKKTHCINGHEFNSTNTLMVGNKRQCRECQKLRARIRRNNIKNV